MVWLPHVDAFLLLAWQIPWVMPSLTPEMGSFYDVGSEMNAHKIGMFCVNFFIPL